MGYRSEVVIVVDKNHTNKILNEIPKQKWDNVSNTSVKLSCGNSIKTTLFHIYDTKWYQSFESIKGFEDVDAVMGILDSIDEIEGDSSYAFVRIGEELNDIEQKGDPDKHGISITNSIEF